jgi:hypothetical protein
MTPAQALADIRAIIHEWCDGDTLDANQALIRIAATVGGATSRET